MKIRNLNNLILSTVFLGAIFIPGMISDKIGGKVSEGENRILAKFPQIHLSDGSFNFGIRKEFENWANDNMGFRDKAVKLNTIIQYKMLGISAKTDTLVGKKDWLFYVTPEILKDYQHLNLPNKDQLEAYKNNLLSFDQYLKNKDIPLVIMYLPDKKDIYSEYYPENIIQHGNISRYDMVSDYISTKTKLNFIAPKDKLMKKKKEALIYSPRIDNAHWNTYGAFIGYRELMMKTKQVVPSLKVLNWNDYDIKKYLQKGMFNNSIEIEEESYSFAPKFKSGVIGQDLGFFEGKPTLNHPDKYRYINQDKSLPKAMIIADSYVYLYMLPTLAESFSELTFIHTHDIGKVNEYVDAVNPDVVMYEFVDRMFDGTMNNLGKWVIDNKELTKLSKSEVEQLPKEANINEMYKGMVIDYCNGQKIENQGYIEIDKKDGAVNITGWSADFKEKKPLKKMYARVNGKIIPIKYGVERKEVATYYSNHDLLNTGFEFQMQRDDIKENNVINIDFIMVGYDGTYRFEDVRYVLNRK